MEYIEYDFANYSHLRAGPRREDSESAGRKMVSELLEPEQSSDLERSHPNGMSVQQIVEACAAQGERLTEATFRKYVQLGLLPRSVRVGRKGKHRGSQGLYPVSIVGQVRRIRKLMAQGFTIDEIRSRFSFLSSDIGQLTKELGRVMGQLDGTLDNRAGTSSATDSLLKREIEEAHRLAQAFIEKLRDIERRLTVVARMERAAV